ncbi:MAG: precorrin-4 C(11)-methyltransferase [Fervidobacterium sp.]
MVYFIGVGPGDSELITLKALKIISSSDVIIYAGSLINQEILNYSKNDAEKFDSSRMNLEEIIQIIEENWKKGKKISRLHPGDPSLYGAIYEQTKELDKRGIEYEVIPGVSSLFGAVSRLRLEFTPPQVSQTLIITRLEGKTTVPEKEKLSYLASHQSSMAIFLSVHMIEKVVQELRAGGYSDNTPVCVVYKATWKDEKIIKGRLENIAELVKKEGVDNFSIIFVGNFLEPYGEYSKLYDKSFSHSFRRK